MARRARPTRPARRRGFSLVEVTIAVVLVGGVYLVALNLVGSSQVTQAAFADRQTAMQLCEELLAEALLLPYESSITPNALGPTSSEAGGPRNTWNDFDDYDGWSANPPVDAAGNTRPGLSRFTRTASVAWVELDSPKTTSATRTPVKVITVSVSVGGKTLATLTGVRAASWPDPDELVEPTW